MTGVHEQQATTNAERRSQTRMERLKILRRMEEDAAGPPPFRVTLARARAKWPEWEAWQNDRRERGRLAALEKFDPIVADLLVDIHLPQLPPPTEVVAHALDLECGHEDFWLVKRADASKLPPKRARCPIFWSCQLNDGRTAVRYIEPGKPEPEDAGFNLTRWSVALACGHDGEVLRAEAEESRVGDYVVCEACGGLDDPDSDAEIVALGRRLPDRMVQNWKVELNCGHVGTDHFIPVNFRDDPAAYRAQHPRLRGLRCINEACDQRTVRGIRRLGVLGKIRTSKPKPPPLDLVAYAASDLRRRLSKEDRQALIRRLQEDE